ncbi:42908_t:CDS:2, partial [Gigaspora margarita]
MSFAEVGESLGPITATAQQTTNFHYYNTQGDSDNEHDYVGTPPYSNDESTLEGDNSEEGMEGVSDNEQITQNILPVQNLQNQGFEGGNDFNTYRNGNGITNGNVIDVGNNNLNNSNNGNTANNMLPPIQMLHRNTPPSIPASTLSAPSSSTRSLGSDIQFSDRLLAFNMHARSLNNRDLRQNHHVGNYNIPPFPDGFPVPQPQSIFRFPNVSQPPSYNIRNDVTVSQSTTTASSSSSNISQQKQSPLRFGFPDSQESRDNEMDDDDEDGSSSANSSSSRKRARSISNDWPNNTSNSHFIPSSIQFGSLEPINRDGIGGRSTIGNNLQASTRSSSPLNRSTPGNHAPVINNYQDVTDSPSTPLSPPINYMPHYIPHPNRIPPTYVTYNQPSSNSSQSSSIPIRPQSQQNFFNRIPYVGNTSRRNFPNPTQQLDTLRRPSHHTNEEQQSYNNYTSVGSEVSNVIYPEVIPERRQHHSNVNVHIQNVSQGHRGSSSSSRWTSRDSSNRNRTDVLTRSIIPNPHFRRATIRPSTFTGAGNHSTLNVPLQESSRVVGSDEEPDTAIDLPESSDSEVNITTIPNRGTPWTNRIIRRHDIRQDPNPRDSRQHINHRTLVPPASTNSARNNSSENHVSDEQLTRRIPTEFSSTHQNLNDEHSPLSRIFGSRVRPSSRRDTGTNSSTTSRSNSVRRDTPTRAPIPRLPDMLLHHDRHHNEERGSESRSRAHGLRNSQSRNVRQGGHYIHHHFIPHYPLLENLIDTGELEDFIDMIPEFWGNGIAANPDNYLDEDEFDSSYEGLLRLSERIGDAKPKGVPEHVINTLHTKPYLMSKARSPDE